MTRAASIGDVLWKPDEARVANANLTAFIRRAGASDPSVRDYASLHRWSVADPRAFWAAMWEFGDVIGERGERILVDEDQMPGAQFFPDARLNFCLLYTSPSPRDVEESRMPSSA